MNDNLLTANKERNNSDNQTIYDIRNLNDDEILKILEDSEDE